VPRTIRAEAVTRWWPVLVVLVVGWQAALIWLFLRLIGQQMPTPTEHRDRFG
jgi:hypothetical protein